MRLLIVSFIGIALLSIKQRPDGEKLFKEQCAACHGIDKAYTGPPFQRIRNYRSEEELLTFMRNPPKFISQDRRMQVLKALYGGLTMTPYPDMKREELKAILDYIDSYPYDSTSPVYAHRRFTAAQQDRVVSGAAPGKIDVTIEFEEANR